MEKLKMHSPDFTQENIAKLAELFPNCVIESKSDDGAVKRAIDFDQLRQELSTTIVDGPQERYQLNWPGKREALLTANAPIAKTLRPCREESVDFDTTQNLYIEGDNLDALKLLQEIYLNKVKIIYIDPPYNTGNDFIYEDDFAEDTEDYLERSNQKDKTGNRMVANSESNGRFHSDWLSMMYSRLKLARNLLSDEGLIFISIDTGEESNLTKIGDEIFGQENRLASIVWEKRFTRSNNAKTFATLTERILCYRKSTALSEVKEPRNEKADSTYSNPDNDPRGVWTSVSYVNPATKDLRPNLVYPIKNPITGVEAVHPTNAWKYECSVHENHVVEKKLYWGVNGGNTYPRLKKFLTEMDGGMVPVDLWDRKSVGTTDEASKYLANLLGAKVFDFPKPYTLIQRALRLSNLSDDIVLDFFSGTAPTAEAVMQLNAEDGGKRKFIMVQLPEACDEKSEAYKAGYKTIAEIGKERIRRVGQKIKAEISENAPQLSLTPALSQRERVLDVGFRVLKIDSSNMKDVYYAPDAVQQGDLLQQVDNIREDRTTEDLLFQVLLDWGVDLALPITTEIIADKKVFFVDGNALAACFETGINEEFIKSLAARHTLRAVFRDSGFGSDSVKINIEQIFKLISPTTEVKTI
jgi:adenine-specific DNA-methyltransferase